MADPGRIVAIDYGSKRIGVAVSDTMQVVARPIMVIQHSTFTKDVDKIAGLLQEYDPVKLLIGLPLDTNGSIGFQAEVVIRWARQLVRFVSVPIVFADESFSSISAASAVKRSRKKRGQPQQLDAIAAATFLQEYLEALRTEDEQDQTLETFKHIE